MTIIIRHAPELQTLRSSATVLSTRPVASSRPLPLGSGYAPHTPRSHSHPVRARYACPNCQQSALRTPRRLRDRLLALFTGLNVRRFRCTSGTCGWVGNLEYRNAISPRLANGRPFPRFYDETYDGRSHRI
jgi:hypothetical protein